MRPLLKKSLGFTLLEVLLVIFLFGLLVTLGVPVYQRGQIKNDGEVASAVVVASLRRAQLLSQAVQNDDHWGVKIDNTSVTIFKGNDYAGRDSNYDEMIAFTGNISVSGLNELYFTKVQGLPNTNGTINLTINNNEIKNISINSQGTIDY